MGPNSYYELNCVDAHCMRCLNDTDYPVLWSAHLHVIQRTNLNLRGMVLGIYGGLGSHRYPIIGSGDTYAEWEILAFEVAMTVSAGNVATGWTHDLGGFMGPIMRDPEMFLRWLQFGAVSYSFRTHCAFCEIRIWKYPNYEDLKATFLMRNTLIPYVYTSSWSSYKNAEMLVTPLYFKWPLEKNAYQYNGTEYLFGPDLLVAPITNPVNPTTNTTQKAIWIPPGHWFNWKTGELIIGPQEINPVFGMRDLPTYARAGAIIPLKYPTVHGTVADPLVLFIFPKLDWYSVTKVYEDDGETLDYTNGNSYWLSEVSIRVDNINQMTIFYTHIGGDGYIGQMDSRQYEFHLRGVQPINFVITCNGSPIPHSQNNTAVGWWSIMDGVVPVIVIAVGRYPIETPQLVVKIQNQTEE